MKMYEFPRHPLPDEVFGLIIYDQYPDGRIVEISRYDRIRADDEHTWWEAYWYAMTNEVWVSQLPLWSKSK